METQSSEQLTAKHCVPCEGGVDPFPLELAQEQVERLDGWFLTHEGKRIRRNWTVKNFMAGMEFFEQVAKIAEEDGHHPDIHLEGYRNVWIELWTHAIGGLSENDFILAAKIDALPIKLKKNVRAMLEFSRQSQSFILSGTELAAGFADRRPAGYAGGKRVFPLTSAELLRIQTFAKMV